MINEIRLLEIIEKMNYYKSSNIVVIKNIFESFERLNGYYDTKNKSKIAQKIKELEHIDYIIENNLEKYQFVIAKTVDTYKTGALLAAKSFSNIEV